MKQENFDYLTKQLMYTGFGEVNENEVKSKMTQGEKDFTLEHRAHFDNKEVLANLNFSLSEQGNYFFNSYNLHVPQGNQIVSQNFRIQYGNTFTLKEAFNLMEGRSVLKEFIKIDKDAPKDLSKQEKYHAWAFMDFKEVTASGDYAIKRRSASSNIDLEKTLEELGVKELSQEWGKKNIIEALQKGNRVLVTFTQDGVDTKRGIQVDAQFKKLAVFDGENRLHLSQAKKEPTNGESQGAAEKTSQTNQQGIDEGAKKKANKVAEKTADQGDATKKVRNKIPRKGRGVA